MILTITKYLENLLKNGTMSLLSVAKNNLILGPPWKSLYQRSEEHHKSKPYISQMKIAIKQMLISSKWRSLWKKSYIKKVKTPWNKTLYSANEERHLTKSYIEQVKNTMKLKPILYKWRAPQNKTKSLYCASEERYKSDL